MSDPRTIDRRLIGRLLTRLANASVAEMLALAKQTDGYANAATRRIGLTGPPGAGKSSVAGRLGLLRASQRQVGVLAIDPSSPRSGGAILGDRIRIDELEGAADLYVRSLASRSAHDGLTDNLGELLAAMAAAGFEEVILETVGVGQSEHAARSQVDTLVLVLVPETGDIVQAMKAGIMELADIYVVNKSDLPGASRMAAEVSRIQHIAPTGQDGWKPPVLLTSISDAQSIQRLSDEIDRHQAWLHDAPGHAARLINRARYRLRSLLERQVAETVAGLGDEVFDATLAEQHRSALRKMGGG